MGDSQLTDLGQAQQPIAQKPLRMFNPFRHIVRNIRSVKVKAKLDEPRMLDHQKDGRRGREARAYADL